MQSSGGKNCIKYNLTLNQIVFFSGELRIAIPRVKSLKNNSDSNKESNKNSNHYNMYMIVCDV